MAYAFNPADAGTTLFAAVLAAARRHGWSRPILDDADGNALTYGRLILASLVLGRTLAPLAPAASPVGLLLPNVSGLVVALLGLNAMDRTVALMNFTAGTRNLASALRTAQIPLLVTSRRFVAAANLEDTIAALAEAEIRPGKRVQIVYLEDLRRGIGTLDKARGAIGAALARRTGHRPRMRPDQPAVVLFTSGTEGVPKAVVLSNRNLLANAFQIIAHAEDMLTPADVVLNPLPMFHSFGLTAGTLMPLVKGMRTVLYPSPLHYRQIPKLIADTQATLLFATDTFLQGYARAAGPGELASVRLVVAGAERVKHQTRAVWDRFGATVLEGYGATECAPVLACNVPPTNRSGSVGRLLPGLETRLEPVDGIRDGGRLLVRGPNVMLGYMTADTPGVIRPPPDGWHDTGDIVDIDAGGFVTIKGRAKRFAKVGGEMISLAAIEQIVATLWPDRNHVVVALADPRRGEQLVLVTDHADASRTALTTAIQAASCPELWVPRQIVTIEAIPLLGSGKVDLAATVELARRMCQPAP